MTPKAAAPSLSGDGAADRSAAPEPVEAASEPVAVGEVLDLTIAKIIPRGLGLGFHQGQAVFVPFAAPGDRLRVRVTARRNRYLTAEIGAILDPGPGRVAPDCPVYGTCGGCQLRHLDRETQERCRHGFVAEALERVARIGGPEQGGYRLNPLLPVTAWSGYRRRAGFKARRVSGRMLLGFYRPGTHRIVDLPGCPILDPRLEALIDPLRGLLTRLSVRDQAPQVDLIAADNGLGMVIHFQRKPSRGDREMLARFARERGIVQLGCQVGQATAPRILIDQEPLSCDDGGGDLSFRPGDFIQVNGEGNRLLLREVQRCVDDGETGVDQATGSAWDLFCGIGNFTLPLARRFSRVLGVDSVASALEQAQANAGRQGVANITWQRADLTRERDVERLLAGEPPALVLLDPPREGAAALVKQLTRRPPRRVVFVACDPATFARDAATLIQGGLTLRSVQPVDLFPHTSHVELVADFRSGPEAATKA